MTWHAGICDIWHGLVLCRAVYHKEYAGDNDFFWWQVWEILGKDRGDGPKVGDSESSTQASIILNILGLFMDSTLQRVFNTGINSLYYFGTLTFYGFNFTASLQHKHQSILILWNLNFFNQGSAATDNSQPGQVGRRGGEIGKLFCPFWWEFRRRGEIKKFVCPLYCHTQCVLLYGLPCLSCSCTWLHVLLPQI